MPKAPGGCRTPPPRCRRGCSATSAARRSPTSAPRPAARPRSSRSRRAASPRSTAPSAGSTRLRREPRAARPRGRDRRGRCHANGRPDRSTPCCSMRPARRPAPSAAIPTSPGSSAKPTSRRSPPCSAGCSTRAVELVKPGGTLVYCTCSLEPEEGEAQRRRACWRAIRALRRRPIAAGRGRRPRRTRRRRRRPAHAALPSGLMPTRDWPGSTASSPPGWSAC